MFIKKLSSLCKLNYLKVSPKVRVTHLTNQEFRRNQAKNQTLHHKEMNLELNNKLTSDV
jgi:hypothetical protein